MKLDHIQLAMPPGEEDRARGFFIEVMGMTEEAKPYPLSERGGCWFRAGGLILHIGAEAGFQPQRKAHPAFVIHDLKALEQKLAALEMPVKWNSALPGRTRFYSTDPFGNRIEFIQAGDDFSEK